MPIRFVALAEIALAIAFGAWLMFLSSDDPDAKMVSYVALVLAASNAAGILGILRRAHGAELWLIAFGALMLLTIAATGLWAPWLFPPADTFVEIMAPAVRTLEALTMLAGAAVLALAAGWGAVLFRLLYLRRRGA